MAPLPLPATLFSYTASPSLSPFNVSVKDYLTSRPPKHHLVGSALVFSPPFPSTPTRILLVQRAARDFGANLWETPGGSCDIDEPILSGIVRELWEESGLVAKKVLRQVGEAFEWVDRGKVWCKIYFEVEVEGTEVRLDEDEHQDFLWATEEECKSGIVVRDGKKMEIKSHESQLATILEGFRLRRESSEMGL